MRLWSIHPKYLDRQGLLAVWRESLLAQSVLLKGEYSLCNHCYGIGLEDLDSLDKCSRCKGIGKIKTPYYNHPQLDRFRQLPDRNMFLSVYLHYIYDEGIRRNYKFDIRKINRYSFAQQLKNAEHLLLTITKGQLSFEFEHLSNKLLKRDYNKAYLNEMHLNWKRKNIEPHPLFKVIKGNIESWEKIQEKGQNV